MYDYLQHHGILGMKWGKLNGPPYPIGSGDHSASEKKAGWKKSLNGNKNEDLYDRNKKVVDNAVRMESQKSYNKGVAWVGGIRKDDNNKLNVSDEDRSELRAHREKATELYDKMFDSAIKEGKEALKNPEFKMDVRDYMSQLFDKAQTYDNKDWFDMDLEEAMDACLQSKKYAPKTYELSSQCKKEIDAFYNKSKDITDKIIGKYGDTPVNNLYSGMVNDKKMVTYKQAVKQILLDEEFGAIMRYMNNHQEAAWYDNDLSSLYNFDKPVITMSEYNAWVAKSK